MKNPPSDQLPEYRAPPSLDIEAERQLLKRQWEAYPLRTAELCAKTTRTAVLGFYKGSEPPLAIIDNLASCFQLLMIRENFFQVAEIPFPIDDFVPEVVLYFRERLTMDGYHAAQAAALWWLDALTRNLPKQAFEYPDSPMTVPLIDLMKDPYQFLRDFEEFICRPWYKNNLVFRNSATVLNDAITAIYRDEHVEPEKRRRRPLTELHEPKELLFRLFKDFDPIIDLLLTPIPFKVPLKTFTEHGFLFAKSGHGKTQTLRAIAAEKFDQDCALFLIDGNGLFVKDIDRIKSIQHRLLILDAKRAPPLNFFKLRGGSREKQMELFFYLFKAIDQGLTERQSTMVAYLIDFMQAIPGANFMTLLEVCEAKELPQRQYLAHTPEITQRFFQNQFFSSDQLVKQTKNQIAQRLYTLVRNATFMAMFNAKENVFDAYEAMQQKKVVIINTDRNALGDQGSAIFGRYILAQCLAAAFQRPDDERHLALIICDEAKAYLDDQSQKILSDARAFGLGLLLATQHPDQLPDAVRKEVVNNTSIKICGPTTYPVVSQLNRDLRCEVDFVMGMKKRDPDNSPSPPYHAEWACYVDNITPQAVKLTVPFGTIENLEMIPPPIITPPPTNQAPPIPNPPPIHEEPPMFHVGDWVNVEIDHALIFPTAVKIVSIQEHQGELWVFVEGSQSAVQMKNVRAADPPSQSPPKPDLGMREPD